MTINRLHDAVEETCLDIKKALKKYKKKNTSNIKLSLSILENINSQLSLAMNTGERNLIEININLLVQSLAQLEQEIVKLKIPYNPYKHILPVFIDFFIENYFDSQQHNLQDKNDRTIQLTLPSREDIKNMLDKIFRKRSSDF